MAGMPVGEGSHLSNPVAIGDTRRRHVLINRNYALLWSGQLISSIGDFMLSATAVLWISQRIAVGQSWAPLAVSGELIAVTVPTFLFGPFAGVFVDRWNKRHTMLVADLLRFALIALLVPLGTSLGDGLTPTARLGAIYTVIVLEAMASLFFNPARLGLVGKIVPEVEQARASGLLFLTLSVGITLGPAIAAPLYFSLGPSWALVLDALSFLVSFAAILAIRLPRSSPNQATGQASNIIRELLEGIRFFAGNRTLRTLLIVTAITLFGSSAINALDIFFLQSNLHAPPEQFGILSAGTGVGILVGSLLATWIVPRIGAARAFWLGTMLAGALIIAYARQTEFGIALVTLAIIGLPSAWLNVAIGPLLLQSTPPNLIGRASAIFTPATNLAALLSTALAGYLASTALQRLDTNLSGLHFGPYDTIYLAGGILITLAGVFAWSQLHNWKPRPTKESQERLD